MAIAWIFKRMDATMILERFWGNKIFNINPEKIKNDSSLIEKLLGLLRLSNLLLTRMSVRIILLKHAFEKM